MHIKVLGTGCKKCETLKENVEETIKELGLDATIEKVEDFNVIIGYGVMNTPALVVDEKVLSKGKVLKVKELKKLFG